jgi:WD40 repeat protein
MQWTVVCRFSAARVVLMALVLGVSSISVLAAAQDEDAVRQRDLVRVVEDEPRLRINSGGHTGVVRGLAFTADSSRLCSAGLDKVVQVWNLDAPTKDLQGNYLRERTLRWEVARGPLGNIFALASSPSDGLLAFAGHGVRTQQHIVLLVNPVDGSLVQTLDAHRRTVCSLAFSADGKWLASSDTDGRVVAWKRDQWRADTIADSDSPAYGEETARLIQGQPPIRPVAVVGSSHVVVPHFVGRESDGRLRWRLRLIGLADHEDVRTLETVHYGMVTALATSPGRAAARMASVDLEGNLFLWDLEGPASARRLGKKRVIPAICFSPDGRRLIVGTAATGSPPEARLEIWDVEAGREIDSRSLPDHVQACAVSPDGQRLAYVGGTDNEVVVEWIDRDDPPIALGGKGRRVTRVAFGREGPPYRIAFGGGRHGTLQRTFDTRERILDVVEELDPSDWISSDTYKGGWAIATRADRTMQLYRDGVPKGVVTFEGVNLVEGVPTGHCWIPDSQGNPAALAVGTSRQNSIYVFGLVEEGRCPILRHFRGHSDRVNSLGVSHDARYLVSGSNDGTVKVWSLDEFKQARDPEGRWGAGFRVISAEEDEKTATRDLVRKQFSGGRLIVGEINEAGPLYRKGVRQGDVITKILWHADAVSLEEKVARSPAEILRSMEEMPWGTQVEFHYERNGAARPAFMLIPAWQPLVSLFTSGNSEWAFWTPEGYYDASINGYTLFGWQVNRGVNRLPDFYRADQFYVELEQPAVIERLLEAGSLQEALRQANVQTQAQPQEALSTLIVSTPMVNILQPTNDVEVRGDTTRVIATINVPAGHNLSDANVYANGVVATRRSLVAQKDSEDGKELTYEWEVPLTSDRRSLIELIVKTDGEIIATSEVVVRRIAEGEPRRAKIYLLSLGINRYGDPDIQPLRFSVADAESTLESLRAGSAGLYGVDTAALLTEQEVTPVNWGKGLEEIKERLKERAVADDLLVIFLAGHGITDARSKEYYFLGHEFRDESLADIPPDYSACISRRNLRVLDDVSCRKLIILDTCHSGAIRLSRSRDPKAAVRSCQESAIFTMAATTREQLAAESKEWQHGVFTRTLLDGLAGEADKMGDSDGVVTLNEVVAYVQKVVPERAQEIAGVPQNPTVAPDHVLSYTRVPLTRVLDTDGDDR